MKAEIETESWTFRRPTSGRSNAGRSAKTEYVTETLAFERHDTQHSNAGCSVKRKKKTEKWASESQIHGVRTLAADQVFFKEYQVDPTLLFYEVYIKGSKVQSWRVRVFLLTARERRH